MRTYPIDSLHPAPINDKDIQPHDYLDSLSTCLMDNDTRHVFSCKGALWQFNPTTSKLLNLGVIHGVSEGYRPWTVPDDVKEYLQDSQTPQWVQDDMEDNSVSYFFINHGCLFVPIVKLSNTDNTIPFVCVHQFEGADITAAHSAIRDYCLQLNDAPDDCNYIYQTFDAGTSDCKTQFWYTPNRGI